MPRSIHLLALVFLTPVRLVESQQQCFYPDGTLSTDDTPCNGSATVSACCKSSAYCLSNGLCLEDGILHRESCTDKSWASDSCPQYCKSHNGTLVHAVKVGDEVHAYPAPEGMSGGSPIMPCTSTAFTCGLHPNNCAATEATFELHGGNDIILRADQLDAAMSTAGKHDSHSSSSPSAIIPQDTGEKPDPNASEVTTSSSTSPPPPSSSSSPHHFTAAQVAGTAIGILLPLLSIIAVLAYLLFREQRKHKPFNHGKDQAFFLSPSSTNNIREIKSCSWSAWSAWCDDDRIRGSRKGSAVRQSMVAGMERIREVSPSSQSGTER